jgi:phospholipase/carboxylesterase
VPLHYEPNYAYPLIVWLHGPQDTHTQLKRIMPHVSVRNYVAVAPAIPAVDIELSGPAPGAEREAELGAALERIDESIEQATARFHIATHRIFLVGLDTAGTLALRIALTAAQRFGGVASLGGPFPQGGRPLANLHRARRLAVLISHGRDSDAYPISRVCDELRLFHAAGLSVNLRQYPCGDELTTQMLADLNVWMMTLVTGARTAPDTTAPAPYTRDEPN